MPGDPRVPARAQPLRRGALLLLQALDRISVGIALFDSAGALIQSNQVIQEVLDRGADPSWIRREIERFVCSLIALLHERSRRTSGGVEELVMREIELGETRYLLRGSCIEDPANSGICLLVTLERLFPMPVSVSSVARRFGLSQQETQVARLLAEGRSNAEIAAELRISPHTARNHTRKVLQKLEIRSRAQVANKLLYMPGKAQ